MFLGERMSHRPAAAHLLEHIPGHRFPNQLSTNLLQLWQNPTVYRAHSRWHYISCLAAISRLWLLL